MVLNADGTVTVTPGWLIGKLTESFHYTVVNSHGITDTAKVTIVVSSVDGTEGDDRMVFTYRDADGTLIDGADGADDVILGHGGNDKILSGGGDDDIFGGADHDFIRGGTGSDLVEGGTGNDVVDGGTGADVMRGGDGDDIYYIDDLGDVIEGETSGHDRVTSMLDWVLADAFEDLWLIEGSAARSGTGNGQANTIRGNGAANSLAGLGGDDSLEGNGGDDLLDGGDGADRLSGGDGQDMLIGGAGGDSYRIDDAGDSVLEQAGGGIDTVRAALSWVLGAHVEHLYLEEAAREGTGNALDNRLSGTALDNLLSGLGGDDRLDGGAGDDRLDGGTGRDTLTGGAGNDTLLGGADADKLDGGAGDDICIGGAGDDRIAGGAGADSFHFALGDGRDTIHDFDAQADRLVFEGLTAQDLTLTVEARGLRLAWSDADSLYLVGLDGSETLDILFA